MQSYNQYFCEVQQEILHARESTNEQLNQLEELVEMASMVMETWIRWKQWKRSKLRKAEVVSDFVNPFGVVDTNEQADGELSIGADSYEEEWQPDATQCRNLKLSFPLFNEGDEPGEWIKSCEQYFGIFDIQEHKRVHVAAIHLKGIHRNWYKSYIVGKDSVDWNEFVEGFIARFAPGNTDSFFGRFKHLKQTGSVQDYYAEFEKYKGEALERLTLIPEDYFVENFVSGLSEEIQKTVRMVHPETLMEARKQALYCEEAVKASEVPAKSQLQVGISKELIHSEVELRSLANLCPYCDEEDNAWHECQEVQTIPIFDFDKEDVGLENKHLHKEIFGSAKQADLKEFSFSHEYKKQQSSLINPELVVEASEYGGPPRFDEECPNNQVDAAISGVILQPDIVFPCDNQRNVESDYDGEAKYDEVLEGKKADSMDFKVVSAALAYREHKEISTLHIGCLAKGRVLNSTIPKVVSDEDSSQLCKESVKANAAFSCNIAHQHFVETSNSEKNRLFGSLSAHSRHDLDLPLKWSFLPKVFRRQEVPWVEDIGLEIIQDKAREGDVRSVVLPKETEPVEPFGLHQQFEGILRLNFPKMINRRRWNYKEVPEELNEISRMLMEAGRNGCLNLFDLAVDIKVLLFLITIFDPGGI